MALTPGVKKRVLETHLSFLTFPAPISFEFVGRRADELTLMDLKWWAM
jgi:hypothetical protein